MMTRHDYLRGIADLANFHDAAVKARHLDAVFACAESLVRHLTMHRDYRPRVEEAAELIEKFLPTTAFINACAVTTRQ